MVLEEFDQRTAELLPMMIMMESELELSMYTISEWHLTYFKEGRYIYNRSIIINKFLLLSRKCQQR